MTWHAIMMFEQCKIIVLHVRINVLLFLSGFSVSCFDFVLIDVPFHWKIDPGSISDACVCTRVRASFTRMVWGTLEAAFQPINRQTITGHCVCVCLWGAVC